MSRHASATRSPVSHASGVVPNCARKRRCRVAGLTAARAARSATVSGSSSRSWAQASSGPSDSAGTGGTGRSTNCRCPPSRCAANTSRRETALATSAPWSRRHRCSPRSSAAALPAAVRTSPSSTNSTTCLSSTFGCSSRKASAHIQCVVARRPSSRPASASAKVPVQKLTTRAPRACVRRIASRTAFRARYDVVRPPGDDEGVRPVHGVQPRHPGLS
ncbi:hypothetical protein STENM223S_07978 [Streptomyces tendae]